MSRTEVSTKLIKGSRGARRRPMRFFAMLSLVALMAAACGSDATSAVAEVEDVTTTSAEVESVTTATAEPEPEPDIESEPNPAPDTAVADFTAAFGVSDADKAWSFISDRCQATKDRTEYDAIVAGYALDFPGAVASNISADVFGDVAAISYDTHTGSGEFIFSYVDQPWAFSDDGKWQKDEC